MPLGRHRTRLHPLGSGTRFDRAVAVGPPTGTASTVVLLLPVDDVPDTTAGGTLGTLADTADSLDVAGTLGAGTAGVGDIAVGTAPVPVPVLLVAAPRRIAVDGKWCLTSSSRPIVQDGVSLLRRTCPPLGHEGSHHPVLVHKDRHQIARMDPCFGRSAGVPMVGVHAIAQLLYATK